MFSAYASYDSRQENLSTSNLLELMNWLSRHQDANNITVQFLNDDYDFVHEWELVNDSYGWEQR